MGRIKTKLSKRVARKLLRDSKDKFGREFEQNKIQVQTLLSNPNKKLRNIVAGYVTRLMKNP